MTWQELKKYISKMDKCFLDSQVRLYDYKDGEEYEVDLTELLINECENDEENDGWVPYLSINEKEIEDENQTTKASLNRFLEPHQD
jgi:hypothetical protein